MQSALDAPVFYVHGNHDQSPQYLVDGRVLVDVQGGVNIHGRVIRVSGLTIAGLEGSMRYRPHDPYMYTEGEMRLQVMRLLPKVLLRRLISRKPLDILVTHSPPFGIHDLKDLPHTGFKVFLPFLKIAQPRYMLHGHVHLYQNIRQRTTFEATEIINVYPSIVIDHEAK